jgi:putative selenium metabolism protein SsnA
MLITNANLITWEKPNRILAGQALHIQDGRIESFGPNAEMAARFPQEERLDAGDQYVMPGNMCAHTHFYGAFARGMAIPGAAPEDFPQILEKLWWPLDKSLGAEDNRYSALVCLADAIRHGTTTLVDHQASPNAIAGSLDVLAEAVDQSGLRASLCYEVTDRDGKEKARAGIQENVRFIERIRRDKPAGGRLSALFGLHASLTLSDETLDECRAAAPQDAGFHIHVAEGIADEYDSLAKSGTRVVDRLQKHGILGPRTLVAHAVHVDARETLLLAESGSWVSHQPRSNMNNAVGVAPVESFLRAGIKVCMGNDGFTNAQWEEMKAAYFVHKLWNLDPRRMNGYDVVQMAIYNNGEFASQLFGETIGVIRPGAQADLIFVDYHPFTPMSAGNLPWHILFGFHESMITTTMVAGKVLMRNRELTTLDEAEIAAKALELSGAVWQQYQKRFA